MANVGQEGDLPVQVVALARTVTEPEADAVPGAKVGRQVGVAHEAAQHDLPLLIAQPGRLADHDPVTGHQLTCFDPSTGSADLVIRRGAELRTPIAAGLLDRELQEPVSGTVVEP